MIKKFLSFFMIFITFMAAVFIPLDKTVANASENTENTASSGAADASDTSGGSSSYKISDLDVEVKVSDDLVVFTRSVTSNNSYLDLIGVNDVEELRSLMRINNVYLEIIPREKVNFEILVSGYEYKGDIKNINELTEDELNSSLEEYVNISNKETDEITETVTDSYIHREGDSVYLVTDITSAKKDLVTVYAKKYYTIVDGKVITYSIQSDNTKITDEMNNYLTDIVKSAEYKEIKKSILENPFLAEITSTLITLLAPIAVLGLLTFIVYKMTSKKKKY